MEIYSTEEQQAEAIKRFFRENGTSLAVGIVLGLGGLYGWKAYNQHQIETAEAASDAYIQLVEGADKDKEQLLSKADDFIAQNGDSSYAVLAAFVAAKQAVEQNELDKAAEKLSWAQSHSPSEELKAIATTRLARVQLAQKNFDKALATLDSKLPEAFFAAVSELKGDIYLAQGDKEKARSAYQAAADKGGLENNPLLQIKLDDLAVAGPAA